MVVNATYPTVSGYSDPDTSVLVEVDHGGQLASQEVDTDWRDGFWQAKFNEFDQLAPGDILTATINGTPNVVTLSNLSAHFDLAKDQVIGSCPSYTPVTVFYFDRQGLSQVGSFESITSDPSGVFTATFSTGSLNSLHQVFAALIENSLTDHLIQPRQLLGEAYLPSNSVEGYAQPSEEIDNQPARRQRIAAGGAYHHLIQ